MLQIQRRYQEGSVFKRGKTKTWYGMFREDVPQADGQVVRRQRKIRLGAVAELPTKHAAMKALQQHMTITKPSVQMKFSELVERWQNVIVPQLKAPTASYYIRSLRSRILPKFGGMTIDSITRYDVEQFLAAQSKKYARNTLRELRSSLSTVLSWAVKNKWIPDNPVAGVGLPHGTGKKIIRTVLAPEQVKAIAAELQEPYATLVLFLAATGLRVSEAVGIQWGDFADDVLHLQRRVYEGKVDALKTKSSKRSLPIPPPLLKGLQNLSHAGDWVFISSNGTPVNPSNGLKRYLQPVARKLGIKLGGWHDFRHTLATKLNQSGVVSDKTVADILGHSNPSVTQRCTCTRLLRISEGR